MQIRKPEKDGLYKRTRYYQSMIDGDLLMAGARYDTLKDTIIIFICPFEILDGKRHRYTFQSICVEDKETVMPDGTTKILLSSKGKMDDVTPDMKAFLEYVDGKMTEDDFVQEIEQEISNIKPQEQERVSYMTYAMKIQEERDEARAEAKSEIVLELLKANQPVSFIAQVSKLSIEKISEIGKQNGISLAK